MIAIRTTVRMLAARRQAPALRADIADLLHNLAKALFDPAAVRAARHLSESLAQLPPIGTHCAPTVT